MSNSVYFIDESESIFKNDNFTDHYDDIKEREILDYEFKQIDNSKQAEQSSTLLLKTAEDRIRDIRDMDPNIRTILLEFSHVCDPDYILPRGCNKFCFDIELTDPTPIWCHTRKVAESLMKPFYEYLLCLEKWKIIKKNWTQQICPTNSCFTKEKQYNSIHP